MIEVKLKLTWTERSLLAHMPGKWVLLAVVEPTPGLNRETPGFELSDHAFVFPESWLLSSIDFLHVARKMFSMPTPLWLLIQILSFPALCIWFLKGTLIYYVWIMCSPLSQSLWPMKSVFYPTWALCLPQGGWEMLWLIAPLEFMVWSRDDFPKCGILGKENPPKLSEGVYNFTFLICF